MRRRHSSLGVGLTVLAALSGAAAPLAAQDQDGALFLLVPIGARAIGLGQAVVADQLGSESAWWNPAGLARQEKREGAIHHSDSFVGQGDAVALVVPSSLLGVITASMNILNFGELPVTSDDGSQVGEALVRSFVYSGTYATPIGDHLSAGITYKFVQLRFDCSGFCPNVPPNPSTSGIDIGAQYNLQPLVPVSLGILLRNLGPRLQVNDTDQADEIPTRLHIGAKYRYAGFQGDAKDARVDLSMEIADGVDLSSPSSYVGLEVAWQERVHLRTGYANESSEASGLSVGLGLDIGSLVLDVARIFEGFSADAGKAPTYLSLRYLF